MVLAPREAAAQPGSIPRRMTLAHAERLLLERNLAVTAQRHQIEASRAARLIANLKPLSTITVSAEGFMVLPPAIGAPPTGPIAGTRRDRFLFFRTDSDAGANPGYLLSFDKLVERGNKRELRTEQAEAELDAAEALMLDAVRSQLFELRAAFVRAMLARQNRALAEKTVEQYNRIEELTRVRLAVGDSPGAELYRVRGGALEFQRALLETQTGYEQAIRDLLNLLGATPDEVEPPQFALSSPTAPAGQQSPGAPALSASLLDVIGDFSADPVPLPLQELRRIALASRSDVIAARHRYRSAQTGLRLARALGVRDLGVSAAFQRIGADNTFGVALQVPIFLDKTARAASAEAEARGRVALAEQRQVELAALTDVERAYQQYLAARSTVELYSGQNIEQIEKLQEIALVTFREGAASMFEVLDSQRTYNQALTAYNQARADYQLSLYELERAVGRPLW